MVYYEIYRDLCHQLDIMLFQQKKQFYTTTMDECGRDQKKLFKFIKIFMATVQTRMYHLQLNFWQIANIQNNINSDYPNVMQATSYGWWGQRDNHEISIRVLWHWSCACVTFEKCRDQLLPLIMATIKKSFLSKAHYHNVRTRKVRFNKILTSSLWYCSNCW